MSNPSTPNAPATSSKELRLHATASVTARRPRIAGARRLACALATLTAVGIGALGASTAPALADGCPNEQLRSENNSTRLPECRAYEMVTPSYTEGFPAEHPFFNDEGALAYVSIGNFAGGGLGLLQNQYVARRSSAGWATTSLEPSPAIYEQEHFAATEGLSTDFRSSLFIARRGEAPADDDWFYYLRAPDGSMTRVGRGAIPGVIEKHPYTEGASPDLTHVVFAHGLGGGSEANAALYEFVGTGNEGPPLPVSVANNGQQIGGEPCLAGISTDGRVIVFGCASNGVWARVGGSATVAVSGSECTRASGDPGGACNALVAAPQFVGMASDGSRVYFTSTQQLVNGDTDQTNDLYECAIPPGAPAPVGTANPCSSLTEVSGNVTGANVERVVSVSKDGSRVYFIAKGALAANLGTNDATPVTGDDNLYAWEKDAAHPAGQRTFVAKLEAGIGQGQSTADGRYLAFTTASRLLASDTDEAPDVYRYDARTGLLLRLSTDTSGTGGNEPGFEVLPGTRDGRAMTADGSTVVFETAEALSPADTDGIPDVYAWREGRVSLISNGGVTENAGTVEGAIGITPSGQDIFFMTYQPLTSGDSGTGKDFYDARIDGGFPMNTPAPCSAEACQGSSPPQPQPPGTSASAAFNGPGSALTAETPPASQPKPKPQTAAQKLAKALKVCKAKHNKKKRTACEKKARNTYRRAK